MHHRGFVEVEMGQRVGRYPVDKIKFSTNKREMLTILSPKPMVTKTHYHEDLGSFFFSETAVAHGLDIKVKYNFIAVRWDTDTKGRLQGTDTWDVVIVSLSLKDYEALCLVQELNGPLNKLMLIFVCENEQYQNVSMQLAGASPLTTDKALAMAVKTEYQKAKPFVPQVIATIHSEKKVAEVLGPVAHSEEYRQIEARQQHVALATLNEPEALLLDSSDDLDFGDEAAEEDETAKKTAKRTAKKTAKKAPKKPEPEEDEEDEEDETVTKSSTTDEGDEEFSFGNDDDSEFD